MHHYKTATRATRGSPAGVSRMKTNTNPSAPMIRAILVFFAVSFITACSWDFTASDDEGAPDYPNACETTVEAVYDAVTAFIDTQRPGSPKRFDSIEDTEIGRVRNVDTCTFGIRGRFTVVDTVNLTELVVIYRVRVTHIVDTAVWQFSRLIYE